MRYHGSSSGESLTAEHLANQDYEMWAHVQWPGEGWVKVCDSFSAKGPANLEPLSNLIQQTPPRTCLFFFARKRLTGEFFFLTFFQRVSCCF